MGNRANTNSIFHEFVVGTWNQPILNVYKIVGMLTDTLDRFDGPKRSIIGIFGMVNNFDRLINSKHSKFG